MVKTILLTIALSFIAMINLEAQTYKWSFAGIFGYYDEAQLQRGLEVYKAICANCHSIKYVNFNELKDLGYNQNQINYLKKTYKSDNFPSIFKNYEQAMEANNGSIPPDLSNIANQRSYIFTNGADYIVNLLTGYKDLTTQTLPYYNPHYYNGPYINMPPPLQDNLITYTDGTNTTTKQYAKDVAAFLYWCSNPKLAKQHELGFCVISFLTVCCLLLYQLKKSYDKQGN